MQIVCPVGQMSCRSSVCLPSVCRPSVCRPNVCRPNVCRPNVCRPNVCRPNVCRQNVRVPLSQTLNITTAVTILYKKGTSKLKFTSYIVLTRKTFFVSNVFPLHNSCSLISKCASFPYLLEIVIQFRGNLDSYSFFSLTLRWSNLPYFFLCIPHIGCG